MNKTYRLVWKESISAWVAVGETVKACGKRSSRALLLVGAMAAVLSAPVFAQAPPPGQLPTGGQVVAGQAGIAQSGASMNITQTTQRAAIDWQTFNVGVEATVNFHQPSSSAVILNRVLSSQPSQIFGQINANGQVFLSNPGGVYFAPGASVNVGGLVATTHGISNDDFMEGNDRFTRDGATGSVINEGTLTATLNGYIALLAPEVRNNGVIIAQMGTVALAAGESYQLQFSNSNTLAGIEVEPTALAALVENGNAVQAPGGLVILSARAADQLQGSVVRNSGVIEAGGLVERGGRILLEGDHITLTSDSRLGATGTHGGGDVLVGGDWQGGANEERRVFDDPHALQQATTVTMEAGATIDASATQNGDGGTVVLWSDITNPDSRTTVAGTILALGGTEGGDGGQIETSGYDINLDGISVRAGADNGANGLWLIDPDALDILQGTANTISTSLSNGSDVEVITAGWLNLATGVTISKSVGTDSTLTLRAANRIRMNTGSSIVNTSTSKLNVVFWANTTNNENGGIQLTGNNAITTKGGHLYMGGGSGSKTWNGLTVPSGNARNSSFTGDTWPEAINLISSNLNAGGGNIELRGRTRAPDSPDGIRLFSSHVQTSGTGSISFDGDAIDSFGNFAYGVLIRENSQVRSASGAISIVGTGGPGSSSTGVMIDQNSMITTTSGAIGITGFYSSTGFGIRTQNGANTIGGASTTGAITLVTNKINLGTSTSINTSGTLTVRPSTNGGTMAIGTATVGTLQLPVDYFNLYFNPRISEITVGGSTMTGTVHVGGVTLRSDLQIWTSGDWTEDFAGIVTLQANSNKVTLNTSNNSWTVDHRITGEGSQLAKVGTGTVTLTRDNTYTGTTTVSAGTLALGASDRISNSSAINVNGGTFDIGSYSDTVGAVTLTSGSIAGTTGTLTGSSYTVKSGTISAILGGTAALTKDTTGTVTLSRANTYTGTTTINQGTLKYGANNVISTGAVTVNGGSTLNMDIFSDTVGAVTLNSGNILGSGTLTGSSYTVSSGTITARLGGTADLTKNTGGTVRLSGANTYSGLTTINDGTLWVTNAAGLGATSGNTIVESGATLDLQNVAIGAQPITLNGGTLANSSGTSSLSGAVTLGANSFINVGGAQLTLSGVIGDGTNTFGITKTGGTGTLTLGAINTYKGATVINTNTGTLTLNGTGTIANSSVVTNNSAFSILGSKTIAAMTGSGTTALGAHTLTIGDNRNLPSNYSGAISGTGGLTKAGNNILTLGGASSYSGTTNITAGTLRLGNVAALGNAGGVSVAPSAVLDLNGINLSTAQALTLRGTGISNGGALINSSSTSATYSGLITLGAASSIMANSGNIVLSNTGTIAGGGFGLTLGGTSTNTGGSIASRIDNTTSGVTKVGNGMWTLGGVNTYTGATTISAGTLRLSSTGTIANSSNVANSGTFSILGNKTIASMTGSGSTALGANTLTIGNASNTPAIYSGIISGTGSLIKDGTGTLTLAGANTYSGTTTIKAGAGTLQVGNGGASGQLGTGGVINNASLVFNRSGALDVASIISGTGSLTQAGAGILTLSGANTYTGATTINTGRTLALNSTGSIAASSGVANSGNFTIAGDKSIAAMTGFGTTALGAHTLTLGDARDFSSLYSGIISGTGGLTKAGGGTLTLGGANTYTGATTISAGTLALGASERIANASALMVDGGATFDLAGFSETVGPLSGSGTVTSSAPGAVTLTAGSGLSSTTFSGVIQDGSGTVAFTKAGFGALTLSGANTYTGATTINGGSLIIRNDDPLAATSTSAYSGSGVLTIESAGASFSSAFDLTSIPITGTLSGLTIGKAGNTANISLGAATVAGPITIYGGDITLNGALIATGAETPTLNTITLQGSGNVTDGASGYVSANRLALTGSGNVTLDHTSNNVNTLAASSVGSLSYVNSGMLLIGTVNPTGISATGPVLIETLSGNLFITENIATTDTSVNAVVLNAGKNSAAGTAAGGDIVVTSGKTVTVGEGGRATLFTGSISGSSGLTALVGSGSGRFRYNSDEAATNYTAPLGTGLYAIYREQPNASGAVSSQSITYGDINPAFTLSGGLQNGDGLSGLTISGATYSTSSTLNVGSYTVDASGLVTDLTALGYNATGITDGSLTVGRKDLNVSYTGVDRVYDGTTDATVNRSDDRVSGDIFTITETAAFGTKDAGIGKTVNVTEASVSGTDAGNYTLIAQASTVATIDKASATVIANSDSLSYNGLVQSVSGFTADGLVNGETIAVLSGVTTSGGSGTNTGNYVHTASGTDNNYNLSFTNGSLTIDRASATVIGNSHIVTYDGLGHSVSGFTVSGLVNGEDESVLTTSPNATGANGINAGSYFNTVTGTAIDGNYNLTFEDGALAISQRPITINADAKTKLEGEFDPALTFRIEAQSSARGLVTGDSISGNLIREAGSGVGTYAIQQGTVTNASNPNYDINYVEANLTVSAVTLPPPPVLSVAPMPAPLTSPPSPALSSSDISVELVQASTVQQDGIISVLVSKDMATAGAGFSFPLPAELIANAPPNAPVQVTLLNGAPLPAWLRFIPETNSFIAAAVPDGAFPIQLTVTIGGRSSTIVISERSD